MFICQIIKAVDTYLLKFRTLIAIKMHRIHTILRCKMIVHGGIHIRCTTPARSRLACMAGGLAESLRHCKGLAAGETAAF